LKDIAQQLQSKSLTLLGMKLRCNQVSASHRRAEWMAILAFEPNVPVPFRDGEVAVNKIEKGTVGNALKHGVVGGPTVRNLVPSHVGDFEVEFGGEGESNHFAREDSKPFVFPTLVTDIEEKLEAQTNPEKGFVFLDPIADEADQVPLPQFPDCVAKCADTRQDEMRCGLQVSPVAADDRFDSNAANTPLNASKIPHLVIEDANLGVHRGPWKSQQADQTQI
jgi:hypothetical protein